jgi:hypothetical protein
LIRLADAALYAAKQAGRNLTVRYLQLHNMLPDSSGPLCT